MTRLILLTTVVCLLVLAPGQHATATTINFDVAADGVTPVASDTNINTLYSSLGVTFGCFNGTMFNICTGNPTNVSGAGNAYAVASPTAASAPNVIGISPGKGFVDQKLGFLSATFTSLQSSVSIDAQPIITSFGGSISNVPFLDAFGSTGNFLGEALYAYGSCNPAATQCPYETLTVSTGTSNIAFVRFSSSDNGSVRVFGQFDNLNFGGGGTAVPEPASILLLGSGLVGLGAWRHMMRTRS